MVTKASQIRPSYYYSIEFDSHEEIDRISLQIIRDNNDIPAELDGHRVKNIVVSANYSKIKESIKFCRDPKGVLHINVDLHLARDVSLGDVDFEVSDLAIHCSLETAKYLQERIKDRKSRVPINNYKTHEI